MLIRIHVMCYVCTLLDGTHTTYDLQKLNLIYGTGCRCCLCLLESNKKGLWLTGIPYFFVFCILLYRKMYGKDLWCTHVMSQLT
jgi:hypothetical protein